MQKPRPEFVIANGLPLNTRLTWIAVLAMIGFGIQVLVSLFLGWLFVLAAVLMGAMRGKSNNPGMVGGGEWKNVTMEELEKAHELMDKADRLKRDSGAYSPTSGKGCALGCLTLLGLGVVAALIFSLADGGMDAQWNLGPVAQGGSLGAVFVIDALTLLVPMWLSGNLSTWQPPHFKMKLEQLMFICSTLANDPELDFQPSLFVAKTDEGSVPTDCKLMVKIKDSDPAFMGIQVQTTINKVQSSSYPYTYSVLIAKPEFGLIGRAQQVVQMPPPGGFRVGFGEDANERKEAIYPRIHGAIVEMKHQGEMDIAVVRQPTKGTGYTTPPTQARAVFGAALSLAKDVLEKG